MYNRIALLSILALPSIIAIPNRASNPEHSNALQKAYRAFTNDLKLIKRCYLSAEKAACTPADIKAARYAAARLFAEGIIVAGLVGGAAYKGYKFYEKRNRMALATLAQLPESLKEDKKEIKNEGEEGDDILDAIKGIIPENQADVMIRDDIIHVTPKVPISYKIYQGWIDELHKNFSSLTTLKTTTGETYYVGGATPAQIKEMVESEAFVKNHRIPIKDVTFNGRFLNINLADDFLDFGDITKDIIFDPALTEIAKKIFKMNEGIQKVEWHYKKPREDGTIASQEVFATRWITLGEQQ
jgi:hypothetical protein